MRHTQTQQPSILVAEDDAVLLSEVAGVLTEAGFVCQRCTTAEMALAESRTSPPDLIVCDVNLKGRSGSQLCQQIRQEQGHHLPIMFLSGAQIPDIIRRSHEAGGTYYLRKPFDLEVLVELVFNALWIPRTAMRYARSVQPVGVN